MSDLASQIQAEQQRLYEISSLTDELADDDAQVLLEWGAAQLPLLIGDMSDVEPKAKGLRRLLRSMSDYVGQVENMGGDERLAELQYTYQAANDLNYPAQDSLMTALVGQFDGINSADVLTILIAWLEDDSLLKDVLGGSDADSD